MNSRDTLLGGAKAVFFVLLFLAAGQCYDYLRQFFDQDPPREALVDHMRLLYRNLAICDRKVEVYKALLQESDARCPPAQYDIVFAAKRK